jgi:hypothetical protein
MTSVDPSYSSVSGSDVAAPFRLLTVNEWVDINMPLSLTRNAEAAWARLEKLGETEDVRACLEYLSNASYDYRWGDESRGRTDGSWRETLDLAYVEGLCSDDAYNASLDVEHWEYSMAKFASTADVHWGFHPLGLVQAPRYYMGKTGWCVTGVELPGHLGIPLLVDEWDLNLPDRGVRLRVVASGERNQTAYWSCDWIGEEDVPGVIADIMPYLADADTFMMLHTLHNRQIDI